MSREFILTLISTFALALVTTCLYLTGEINAGERQIADGQKAFEQGLSLLEKGKAMLEAGRQELATGRKDYQHAKGNLFFASADKLVPGGIGFKGAEKEIAEGGRRVAAGDDRVAVWEMRLIAFERELRQGREQVRLARGARLACALGAVFFAAVAIVLWFKWRRSWAGRAGAMLSRATE